MRKNWHFIFVIGVFFSCGNESTSIYETKKEKPDIVVSFKDTFSQAKAVTEKLDFDTTIFKDRAWQLLSALDNNKHLQKWKTENDILNKNQDQYMMLKTKKITEAKTTWFILEDDKSNYLDFTYRVLSMRDTLESTRLARDIRKEFELAPGMTYTWNKMYISKNKIYWITCPCTFSGNNFKKLKEIFRNSIREIITDSIDCRCGGGCK